MISPSRGAQDHAAEDALVWKTVAAIREAHRSGASFVLVEIETGRIRAESGYGWRLVREDKDYPPLVGDA